MVDKTKSQIDKFKELAREAETDDREESFDRVLKKVAKADKVENKEAQRS